MSQKVRFRKSRKRWVNNRFDLVFWPIFSVKNVDSAVPTTE